MDMGQSQLIRRFLNSTFEGVYLPNMSRSFDPQYEIFGLKNGINENMFLLS